MRGIWSFRPFCSPDFVRSMANSSLFIYCKEGFIMYFLVYVDDIVLTGSCSASFNVFIRKLSNRFALKDMGTFHHFLDVQVLPSAYGFFLSQC